MNYRQHMVASVGTSLLTNRQFKEVIEENLLKEILKHKHFNPHEYSALRAELFEQQRLKKVFNYMEANPYIASAELNTIKRILDEQRFPIKKVYLIATDTVAGVLSTELIGAFLEEKWDLEAEVRRIEGLNVEVNDKDIVRKGFQNLINFLVYEKGEEAPISVYNVSGGFKAVIPVFTLVASFLKVPLVYIYERSDYLIEIPPFPFTVDEEIVKPLESLLEKLEDSGAVECSEVFTALQSLPEEERKRAELLFEQEDSLCTLSTIGMILWEAYKAKKPVELIETDIPPEKKKANFGKHHGVEEIQKFWKRLRRCSYIVELVNSTPYYQGDNTFPPIEGSDVYKNDVSLLRIKVPGTYYTCIVRTTARNKRELEKIKEIIRAKYYE
ncbi:MAG: putative CRISPR-associated protein [Aquificae bacterium]|nr:putative CRISPR-associated protein [Aquificota bacterium]